MLLRFPLFLACLSFSLVSFLAIISWFFTITGSWHWGIFSLQEMCAQSKWTWICCQGLVHWLFHSLIVSPFINLSILGISHSTTSVFIDSPIHWFSYSATSLHRFLHSSISLFTAFPIQRFPHSSIPINRFPYSLISLLIAFPIPWFPRSLTFPIFELVPKGIGSPFAYFSIVFVLCHIRFSFITISRSSFRRKFSVTNFSDNWQKQARRIGGSWGD